MEYKVKKGDSFWSIAKQFNIPMQDLMFANTHIKDPNKIRYDRDILTIPEKMVQGGMSKTPPQPSAFRTGFRGLGAASDQPLEQAALFENLLGALPFLKLSKAARAIPTGSTIMPRESAMLNQSIRNYRSPAMDIAMEPASPFLRAITNRNLGSMGDDAGDIMNLIRRIGAE